ncbi:MAG: arginine deiminase family protein [Bacteroidota bacterium]
MKPVLKTEYNPLKKVLVHTPSEEHAQLIPWEGEHPLMGPNPRVFAELKNDHTTLVDFLKEEIGKENVLELKDLLIDIFENTDYRRRFTILQDTLHTDADKYIDHLMARGIRLDSYDPEELVKDLIYGYPRELTINNGRLPNIIIPPKRELMWMRDSSAVTQCGVIINEMASTRRKPEPTLIRSVFKYHPMFDEDSIFLDLVQFHRDMVGDPTSSGLHEKFLIEGGNVLILSEDTLAIGVGNDDFLYSNRTTRPAFRLLVRKIFTDPNNPIKRVYLVNVPDLRGFIHLDTVFNMVGPKAAILMPYIFGSPTPSAKTSAKQVLQKFVGWLRQNIGVNQTDLSRIPTVHHFEHAGKVEVYDRDYIRQKGTVERLPQPSTYFIDQLIKDGLIDPNLITWVGGNPDDYPSPFEHLKTALFEQHNMAGNVFTVKPFRAVAYHRNEVTIDKLDTMLHSASNDAHLELMSSNEIRTDNGGPHCLTLPLEREE